MLKKIILILIILVGIANAETGNITISDDKLYDYSIANAGGGNQINFSKIIVDNTNYNYLSSFHFHPTGITFVRDFEGSSFTFVSGATGTGGTVWYDKNQSAIYYVFSSDMVITGSIITILPNENIFANLTGLGGGGVTAAVSSTEPVALFTFNDAGHKNMGTYHSVSVALRATDQYNVAYLTNNLFSVSITKNSYVDSKYFIHGAVSSYSQESTFNKVNIVDAIFQYNDGLYLNATLASGAYTNQLINSTGISGYVPPEESPTDNINPDTGVGIVFDSSDYAIGDIANISWIRTISTPLTYTDSIEIQYPDDSIEILASSPPDTGFTKVLLTQAGTQEVRFVRTGLFGDQTILDSDTATVGAETPSYIIVPAQVARGKLFNATYKIGWTLSSGTTAWIRTYHWDDSLNQWEPTYQSFSVSGVKGVETNDSIILTKIGKYMISLCDVLQGCKASTTTTSYFNGSEVTTNITISNITIDKTTYSYGETMLVKTAVDNFNWSNKAITVDYYDYATGIIQVQKYTQDNPESFPLYISDLTFSGSGTSALRLIGENDTGKYTLAYVNFTLSPTDSEGYGLSYTGNASCRGGNININVIVPAGEIANLSISADNAVYNKDYVINGSKIIPYKIVISGTYYITLRKDGEAKRLIIINTGDCSIIPISTPPTGQTGTQQATQLISLMTSSVFWALIIVGGLMIMMAWKTRDGLPTGIIGIFSMGIFTFVGWLPAWIFFSVFIIGALLIAASIVEKQIKNAG